jgi:nucleoside-diphosphate-sugar epimerase
MPIRTGGQRVLVTGATGFLGRRLCARLQAEGVEIHAVSRSRQGNGEDGIRWSRVGLEEGPAVERLVQDTKPEVIFHLSGLSNGAPSLDLVQATFQSQLASTVNVLTAATRSGCRRVILIGSLEEPTDAPAQGVPTSPYAAAKWGTGMYARMFHRLYQTPVVVARIYMAYGPGQAEEKIVPYTILSLLNGRPPRLSSGRRALDWIYVDDAVDGLVRTAAADEDIGGTTLEFGSGTPVTIREVVDEIVTIIEPKVRPEFGALPDRPADAVRTADSRGAATLLGWRARTSLSEGLRRTVEWYAERRTPSIARTADR